MSVRLSALLGIAALYVAASATPLRAAPELVVNGNFSAGPGNVQITPTNTPGWSSTGDWNAVFTATGGDSPGAPNQSAFGAGVIRLYGPNGAVGDNFSANGLTASPVGGNYVAADADVSVRKAVSQTVTGLTAGALYVLQFWWAGAELKSPNTGPTQTSWQVSLGSATQSTGYIDVADKGFTPWRQATMFFTATAASQVLSFLAVGTPSGLPPTSLLDGVSLMAAPEPTTWALVVVGLLGVTVCTRVRRRAQRGVAAA